MLQPYQMNQIVKEINEVEQNRQDVLVKPEAMAVSHVAGRSRLFVRSKEVSDDFHVSDHAHDQIASKAGIPRNFCKKLREEEPDLYEKNVNQLLRSSGDNPYMLRILDGEVKGFVSNQYKRLDHRDLLQTLLPVFDEESVNFGYSAFDYDRDTGQLQGKFIFEEQCEVDDGDPVNYGLYVSNGEWGGNQLSMIPGLFRVICFNGMFSAQWTENFDRRHVGSPMLMDENAQVLPMERDEANDTWRMVRRTAETLANAEDSGHFQEMVADLTKSRTREIENRNQLLAHFSDEHFQGEETPAVFKALDEDTQFGLSQAVTRVAHEEVESYQRSTELEEIGANVASLNERQWEQLQSRAESRSNRVVEEFENALELT